MTTKSEQKIRKMLSAHKQGTVCVASWLERQGISRDLQAYYRRSGWLVSIGAGAFVKPDDNVSWSGGLYALQHHLKAPIHAGAMTALSLKGLAHYVRLRSEKIQLFSPTKTKLPAWFRNHDWGSAIEYISTGLLPIDIGLIDYEEKTYSVRISSPERAFLECLYLAPEKLDLVESYHVMEGLITLFSTDYAANA
ncbi:MAG: AbiEi antitoxin N-terminal domain-containing protein [Gammaproteobacteria bacterium]